MGSEEHDVTWRSVLAGIVQLRSITYSLMPPSPEVASDQDCSRNKQTNPESGNLARQLTRIRDFGKYPLTVKLPRLIPLPWSGYIYCLLGALLRL
jgi:hypothetical protein